MKSLQQLLKLANKATICRLSNQLVSVRGRDSFGLIQGLITNDVNLLKSNRAIYTLFLSIDGRVIFDSILHRSEHEEDEILIECDDREVESLVSHLKKYKMRKKESICPNLLKFLFEY